MKWLAAVWLLTAGGGTAFHIIKERERELAFLNSMEQSLQMLAYYMYQWHMPVEEAVRRLCEEEAEPILKAFYKGIWQAVLEKKRENLGQIWQIQSRSLFKQISICKNGEKIWQDSFLYLPIEPEELRKSLFSRAEQIKTLRSRLEEKYRGEQRLVLALGIFSGAFLCLILW